MANQFSLDTACKALWQFEPGALLADTIGGNTLVEIADDPSVAVESITSAGSFKEGSGSIHTVWDHGGTDYAASVYIADADLDAGFPLKNGDAVKVVSIAGWFKIAADMPTGPYCPFLQKNFSVHFGLKGDLTEFYLRAYDTIGGSQIIYSSGSGFAVDKWYHFGLAIDGIAKTYLIRVYDADADTAQTFSGALTNELRIANAAITIGSYTDALFDEFVVFDDLKTADDFDEMRQGIYLASPAGDTMQLPALEISASFGSAAYPTLPALECSATALSGAYMSTLQEDGSHPRLPTLGISARAGERIDGDFDLPGVQLTEMRAGSRLEGTLPDMACSATASGETMMRVSGRVPVLTVSGGFAARADSLRLPAMSLDVSIIGERIARLEKTLPGLEISAAGSTPVLGTLDKDLPALSIVATGYADGICVLDKKISPLRLTASMLIGATCSLDAILPALIIEEGELGGASMALDAYLPTLVAGQSEGPRLVLSNDSRFTGYVMRYVR